MTDLAAWLLERIAEDEAAAASCRELPFWGSPEPATVEHFKRWLPRRVLTECEAKRRIVDDADGWASSDCNYGRCSHRVDDYDGGETHWRGKYGYRALTALALPYADRPDYREEWRP